MNKEHYSDTLKLFVKIAQLRFTKQYRLFFENVSNFAKIKS